MLRRPGMLAVALAALLAMGAMGCGNGDDDGSGTGASVKHQPLEGTEWVLNQEASTLEVVAPEVNVTARFVAGALSGSSGCNSYFTTYNVNRSRLSVTSAIGSTLKACGTPASNVELAYIERLPQVRSYAISGRTLTLTTSTKGADLVYRAVRPGAALNGDWEVTSYFRPGAITSVVAGSTLTATFDNGQISGNAGCNNYTATYEVDGTKISIGPIASTQRACLDGLVATQESEYLAALALARTYSLGANGLTLFRDGGTIAVTYAPA